MGRAGGMRASFGGQKKAGVHMDARLFLPAEACPHAACTAHAHKPPPYFFSAG